MPLSLPTLPREMVDTNMAAAPALRVAVSDGDTGFVQILSKRLDRLGWEHVVLTRPVPVERLIAMRLGAFVVDLAPLGPQGWPYLERMCRELPALPVIVCTGPSTVAQRVRGLRLGADDWVTKPCHPEELIARVEAGTRRRRLTDPAVVSPAVAAGELEIRADQFQAFARGRSVNLTRREFELISLLAAAEGRVLEREQIYQRVWGYTMTHGDRSVDVFVRKLRAKLQRASPGWTYIHTHFGVGYRFAGRAVGDDATPQAKVTSTVGAIASSVPPAAPSGGELMDGTPQIMAAPSGGAPR